MELEGVMSQVSRALKSNAQELGVGEASSSCSLLYPEEGLDVAREVGLDVTRSHPGWALPGA